MFKIRKRRLLNLNLNRNLIPIVEFPAGEYTVLMSTHIPLRGRGASENPPNRFIPLYREKLDTWTEEDDPAPVTRFFRDTSRTVLNTNDSPDIPFTYSLNPY